MKRPFLWTGTERQAQVMNTKTSSIVVARNAIVCMVAAIEKSRKQKRSSVQANKIESSFHYRNGKRGDPGHWGKERQDN